MSKHPIPREMQQKLDKIMAMDVIDLNEAYVRELSRQGVPLETIARNVQNEQPTLDQIYQVLIPELFQLAAERKRQRAH